jgi:pimeloyl-ACP methyl ester carboxylesterase
VTPVVNGDVTLATWDTGGDGPCIVLMHGLGDTHAATAKVAAGLPGWRVVTMDLRGHGASTSGPWDFASAVSDLDAVVAHYELESPYVGGHSLGGMVALRYALAGRPVAGVVNVDGWGPGLPERYDGEDPVAVAERLASIASGELPSRLARAVAGRTRQAREGTTTAVLEQLRDADVVAWHRDAPCRSLAFNATAPAGRVIRVLMGSEMARLGSAHRNGLRRDLASLDPDRVTVVEVDATHGLIRTRAADVAAAIVAFHEASA